jgi:hypothetical protein
MKQAKSAKFVRCALLASALAASLSGCAVVTVAGAAAGAAVSVAGAVVSTGVEVTGKVVGAGIDAVSSSGKEEKKSD